PIWYRAGPGAPYLVQKAIGVEHQWMWDQGLAPFKAFQLEHAHKFTQPYPGISEMLDALAARGLRLAVLSNKPDAATRQVVAEKLPRWTFDVVHGHRENVPLKPDPGAALAIAEELAIEPSRWLYLGDTDVDMKTAMAAGMFAVGVLWGFRDEAELRENGARAIVKHPSE